jgi:hypothetical protein
LPTEPQFSSSESRSTQADPERTRPSRHSIRHVTETQTAPTETETFTPSTSTESRTITTWDACTPYATPTANAARPFTLYNVTNGSGTIWTGAGPVITYVSPGNTIGPVPSGSALDVELIDPAVMWGFNIDNSGAKVAARVFRAINKTQSDAETNWLVGSWDILGGRVYQKYGNLRVTVVGGVAKAFQPEPERRAAFGQPEPNERAWCLNYIHPTTNYYPHFPVHFVQAKIYTG